MLIEHNTSYDAFLDPEDFEQESVKHVSVCLLLDTTELQDCAARLYFLARRNAPMDFEITVLDSRSPKHFLAGRVKKTAVHDVISQ